MSQKVEELKRDIDELNSLLQQAKRQKTKDVLELQVRKLQTEVCKLAELTKNTENKCTKTPTTNTEAKCYEVKLTNYCWDQSDKFVKLYVTLNNVQTLPLDAINCHFDARSIDLRVMGLENRNYHLPISDLCEEVDSSRSNIKVKNDMIVIFLAKKLPKNWSHVTRIEKTIKEAKTKTDMGDSADPESSLMNLMKKMYQDGDDNMKRTIAKAWTESQDKKSAAGSPDYPNL